MTTTLSHSSQHVHALAIRDTHPAHSGCVQHSRCVIVRQHSSLAQNVLAQMLHVSSSSSSPPPAPRDASPAPPN
jgi:DNA-binding transcriptional regulator YiaG